MPESQPMDPNGLKSQLAVLQADRDLLKQELGVSDAAEIVAMVRSLEAQLNDLYRDKEENP